MNGQDDGRDEAVVNVPVEYLPRLIRAADAYVLLSTDAELQFRDAWPKAAFWDAYREDRLRLVRARAELVAAQLDGDPGASQEVSRDSLRAVAEFAARDELEALCGFDQDDASSLAEGASELAEFEDFIDAALG